MIMLLSSINYSNEIPKNPPFPKPNGPGPYPEFPIDGGLSYLLIAGVVYGVYALRKRDKD